MLRKLFKKRQPEPSATMLFDAEIGGYYTYKNADGTWTIYRMLDFTVNAIHCTLYRDTFDHKPTLQEAMAAHPAILHAPLSKLTLFDEPELELLGAKPIEPEDLEGYVTYLHQMGEDEAGIKEIIGRVGQLARGGGIKMRLTKIGNRVEGTEA